MATLAKAKPALFRSLAWGRRTRIKPAILLVGLLTLLAFTLRVLRLDFQPLWWDEGYSVWFATHPLGQIAALTALDIHPPLYYAMLHGWIGLLGAGPVALRLLSVAAGALARPGRVEEGTTVSDFDEAELRQQRSVGLALAPFEVDGVKVNLASPTPVRGRFNPGTAGTIVTLSCLRTS